MKNCEQFIPLTKYQKTNIVFFFLNESILLCRRNLGDGPLKKITGTEVKFLRRILKLTAASQMANKDICNKANSEI